MAGWPGDKDEPRKQEGRFRRGFKERAGKFVGADGISSGLEAGKSALRDAFGDDPAKSGMRQESFAAAMRRQGLGPVEVAAAGNRQRIIAFICLAVGGLLVLRALWGLVAGDEGMMGGLYMAVVQLCILALMLVLAWRASFRNWQIRNRRLGGLEEFNMRPEQWWPRHVTPEDIAGRPGKGLAVKREQPPAP